MPALQTLEERFGNSFHCLPEPYVVAFAMITHGRLGKNSSLYDMPSVLVELILNTCAKMPRIPKGDTIVPMVAVPRTVADFQTHVQSTRTLTANGLWVSGPFCFYSDPQAINGMPNFEHHDFLGGNSVWYSTFDSVVPSDQGSYFIIVKIDFSLPILPALDDGMVNLSSVPNVWRSVANLTGLSVPLVDYEKLEPGGYRWNLIYPNGGVIAYKRVVQGTHMTTLRDVWHAVSHAEGWGASLLDYDAKFPADKGDMTVQDYMHSITPESDSDNAIDELTEEEDVFWRDGGHILEFEAPSMMTGN